MLIRTLWDDPGWALGWVTCAALTLSVACGSGPTAPTAALGETFVLAPGERVSLQGTSLTVGFVGVSGDSRCPADALCIQGGDAIVTIEVRGEGRNRVVYELHTGDMRPVTHDDILISLVDLSPYPFSSRTIAPDEYRATLTAVRVDV